MVVSWYRWSDRCALWRVRVK